MIAGLETHLARKPSDAWARVELLVNTGRMARRLTDLLCDGSPRLLPKIRMLTSLSDQVHQTHGLPPEYPGLRRRFALAQLIDRLLQTNPDLAPRTALFDLSDSLASLMDELHDEGVSPQAIINLDVGDLSAHWARAQKFIELAISFADDTSDGGLDPSARLRLAVETLIADWHAQPPQHPVIVVGSTGSRGTTALLMEAVSRLPQGAVVLPGYDFDQPEHVWQNLDNALGAEDHPQFRFRALMQRLELKPTDIKPWAPTHPVCQPRNKLLSLALRPAPVTNQWLQDGPDLTQLSDALAEVTLVEAPSSRIEAQAIALALREAAEKGISAALITPDRLLARHVTAALDRWRIEPDDSAGRPLALSAPGRLLRQVAELMGAQIDGEALITLLKHPLAATGGADRGPHLRLTRELELHLRRCGPAFPKYESLKLWATSQNDPIATDWVAWLSDVISGLTRVKTETFKAMLSIHLQMTEQIATGPQPATDTGELWLKQPGRKARDLVETIAEQADAGGHVSPYEYADLFQSIMANEIVYEDEPAFPGIMIWGTLEARVQGADLVILGGLNEGIWPSRPAPDPWLNRKMRQDSGLLLPDRRIGLQAHDFQQAMLAPQVILTRTTRDEEAETVPSRWINRLANLLNGLGGAGKAALSAASARGDNLIALAETLDKPTQTVASAPRPAPLPPVAHRPKELSFTEVEHLRRDPYSIYAKRMLKLAPIDPLRQSPDARLRGTVLHDIMARFTIDTKDRTPTQEDLICATDTVLDQTVVWPAARRLWRARIVKIAAQFITQERQRRACAKPIGVEISGSYVDDNGFRLYGVADRIDEREDGTLVLYDYKTGRPPTANQRKHYNRQLPLEAAMAEAGAFADIPAALVHEIAYLGLGRDLETAGITKDEEPDFIAQSWDAYQLLLSHFQDPAYGYLSRRAPFTLGSVGEYDHLARYGEWDISTQATPEHVK